MYEIYTNKSVPVWYARKIWLVMRLTTVILIATLMQVSGATLAQKISLSKTKAPLKIVLQDLKSQTGYIFLYTDNQIKIARPVNIDVKDKDFQEVLKEIFEDQPLTYTINENTITLAEKKEPTFLERVVATLTNINIYGRVVDSDKRPLPGASVKVKKTGRTVSTDANGKFFLRGVEEGDVLVVSFVGYLPKEVSVSADMGIIVLEQSLSKLDEVMVQAYGTTTRRLSVGEITQINARDIERQPISNPIQALQGLVPGLLVTPTSGFSGAPIKLEIRGRNGIDPYVTSDPLYVIDGMPLTTLNLGLNAGYQYGSPGFTQSGSPLTLGQSPFFSLNPGDIESITVLKDASATAMYGSRAGNGVILITTKKGKPGTTQFSVSLDQSVNKVVGHWDMLNTPQYLEMRREAFKNDGITPTVANAPDLTYWDANRYTDWQKELLNSSKTTNVQTSLSGGNNFVTFRMGASYSAIQDLAALSDANKNKKATVNLNLNHTSLNQKLTISFLMSYAYTNTNRVSVYSGTTLAPNIPPILDQRGNLNYNDWNAVGMGSSYPFGELLSPNIASTYFLNGSASISYQLIKGLTISTALGYNNLQASNLAISPIAAQNPINNPLGFAIFGNNGNIAWTITPQAVYTNYIGKGKLGITIASTLNSTTAQGLTTSGSGYTSDQLINSINNAAVQTSSQTYAQNKYIGAVGRVNYNWEDKYIAEVSGNRDGSSSFGPGRQFGNFWSAGVTWIASEEKWMKKVLPAWTSLIKFSGTYGTTGISGGDYQYFSQWANSASAIGGNPLPPYNGSLPLLPVHAVNQDYHWQTDRQLNLSLDLGFLNDRFNLHLSHYQKHVNDQLSDLPTPIFTGFPSIQGNSKANVQNTGWEGALQANLISSSNFSWSANLNFSVNKNKLLAFPGIEYTSYYTQYAVGKSLNTIYVLHYTGIDPQTGRRTYEDYNRNGKQQEVIIGGTPGNGLDDRYIEIDPTPKFFGGAGTSLRYKNLTLDLQFNFEKKVTQVAYLSTPGGMLNIPATVFNNHWQKPGDIAVNPRFTTLEDSSDSNFAYYSDGGYTDGSFIRLNTVAIGYSLPDKVAKKMGASGLRFTVAMQNIFTLTKYDGIDPDATFGTLPQPKVFNGKITFNF